MINSYKLVFVNIFYLSFISLIYIICRKKITEKKLTYLFWIISLSIGISLSVFRNGSYESGDFTIHVYRSIVFFKNLLEGYLIPSWAGDLNSTYGLPLFLFNYTFPYYGISLIHLLGFSFVNSLKIFLVLNIFMASFFSYLLGYELFNKKNLTAFIFAIFYIFFPYHLISLHFKVTIGEITSYTLIPLLFYFLIRHHKTQKYIYLLYLTLIYYLVFISHIFIGIFLGPVLLSYLFYLEGVKLKIFLKFLIILLTTLLLSSYQWLPTLIFKSQMYISTVNIELDKIFFPSLSDLIYSPWRFGLLFQGPKGEISYLLGYVQLFILLISLVFIIKNKYSLSERKHILFWIFNLFIYLFLVLPPSKIIWSYFKFLAEAGPHRLLIIVGLIFAFVCSITLSKIRNKKSVYLLIFLTITSTILNWGQRNVLPAINDNYLLKKLPLSTYEVDNHFYAATIYQNPKKLWQDNVPITYFKNNQFVRYETIQRSENKHIYKITISKNTQLITSTLYFPGWKVYANNESINIKPSNDGLITFKLNKGIYVLTMKYEDVFYINLSKKISMTVFISLLVIIIINKFISRASYKP